MSTNAGSIRAPSGSPDSAPKHAAPKHDAPMGPSKGQLQAAARAAAKARSKLAEDVERLCADAGITLATLAREAGVPYQQLWQMMAGKARPSIETYAKLAIPLGADLATRLYPNTGPLIRDRHQARIAEAFLPRATRATALEFANQLALAYPAHPEDALASLTGAAPWPGAALVWAEIKLDGVRFLPTRLTARP